MAVTKPPVPLWASWLGHTGIAGDSEFRDSVRHGLPPLPARVPVARRARTHGTAQVPDSRAGHGDTVASDLEQQRSRGRSGVSSWRRSAGRAASSESFKFAAREGAATGEGRLRLGTRVACCGTLAADYLRVVVRMHACACESALGSAYTEY